MDDRMKGAGMNVEVYLSKFSEWLMTSGLQIVLILVMMMIALKVGALISAKLINLITKTKEDDIEMQKRADTLSSIIRYVLNVLVFVMAGMMILKVLGAEIGVT